MEPTSDGQRPDWRALRAAVERRMQLEELDAALSAELLVNFETAAPRIREELAKADDDPCELRRPLPAT